ncbi:MAG: Dabb family protein [Acidimicrobiia bacterium]
MTLRHVVCFRWEDAATDEAKEAVRSGLAALPGRIPEILSYQVGHDTGIRDTSWDMAVVAEFASSDDFLAYVAHPDHQAVIDERVTPIVAERVSVQFET